jgi:hypothetical protein
MKMITRPDIVQVLPTKNYTVYVFFDNGEIKEFSLKEDIEKGGIFEVLKDINFFMERCTVMNHTLAWDVTGTRDNTKCIDICPDTIYEEGITVKHIKIA